MIKISVVARASSIAVEGSIDIDARSYNTRHIIVIIIALKNLALFIASDVCGPICNRPSLFHTLQWMDEDYYSSEHGKSTPLTT
jgi:hypothetical protein